MTSDFKIALRDLLRKSQGEPEADALREALRRLAQELMELEVSELVGAQRYERAKKRKAYRNGHRSRLWDTRLGTIALKIPKLRQAAPSPAFLERRRRAEKAPVAVIQEAYVHGVSTRKGDELVRALGLNGVVGSEVSRLCADLDERMKRFRNRPLEGESPSLWLDAKAIQVRQDGRVVNMAAVVAIGVKTGGEREGPGFDVGAQVAALPEEAEEDVLADRAFPPEHGRRIHSTNVLERLNREPARRFDVVGIFPDGAAAMRLLGAVFEEQQEEGMASRKDFSSESMTRLTPAPGSFSEAATLKEGVHDF